MTINCIKNYNLNREEYKEMNDIAQMMMNETEHYDTAYEAGIEIGTERGIRLRINQKINQRNIEIAKKNVNRKYWYYPCFKNNRISQKSKLKL